MLEGIDYRAAVREPPSQMETCFAVFANVLELDEQGEPVNEKYAERRAAAWLYQYCTGGLPPASQSSNRGNAHSTERALNAGARAATDRRGDMWAAESRAIHAELASPGLPASHGTVIRSCRYGVPAGRAN
jgi:hypothetical protein